MFSGYGNQSGASINGARSNTQLSATALAVDGVRNKNTSVGTYAAETNRLMGVAAGQAESKSFRIYKWGVGIAFILSLLAALIIPAIGG